MITGYAHFVQLADTLQWDETAIDYSADREAWPALEDAENDKVLGLVAGFCIAETSVAGQLGSYQAAASRDDSMEACFRAQARDEARHARFFDLVAAEVAGVPGANPAERQDVLRTHVAAVGISDRSAGVTIPIAAIGHGASIIEKSLDLLVTVRDCEAAWASGAGRRWTVN